MGAADTTPSPTKGPSLVAVTAPERLTKLRNWLRGLRALSIRQDEAGQAFAGILEAFEERGCAPETVASDIDALIARAEAAEANARRLEEALREASAQLHLIMRTAEMSSGDHVGQAPHGELAGREKDGRRLRQDRTTRRRSESRRPRRPRTNQGGERCRLGDGGRDRHVRLTHPQRRVLTNLQQRGGKAHQHDLAYPRSNMMHRMYMAGLLTIEGTRDPWGDPGPDGFWVLTEAGVAALANPKTKAGIEPAQTKGDRSEPV